MFDPERLRAEDEPTAADIIGLFFSFSFLFVLFPSGLINVHGAFLYGEGEIKKTKQARRKTKQNKHRAAPLPPYHA